MYRFTPEFEGVLEDYDLLLDAQKEKKVSKPKWEKLLKQRKGA